MQQQRLSEKGAKMYRCAGQLDSSQTKSCDKNHNITRKNIKVCFKLFDDRIGLKMIGFKEKISLFHL